MTIQIKPNKEYSATEILRGKFFPWALHHITLTKMIENDMVGENFFEAKVTGKGLGKRYLIKGSRIIRFHKNYGLAIAMLSRQPKQTNDKRNNN